MESVKSFFSDKKNIAFVVAFVLLLISCLVIFARLRACVQQPQVYYNEGFDSDMPMEELPPIPQDPQDRNGPFVDTRTGSLSDGPGMERGQVDGVTPEIMQRIPSNLYFLDDGANGELSVANNLCSKSCCSEQWPTPFAQKSDPFVCANKDKFVPSKMFCSNSFQDAGCLCLTKKQNAFLNMRGGNGREWF